MPATFDAIIIGAGHNGLTCANYLARGGLNVLVLEARGTIGGACVSEQLLPGATFSSCSYIQMMLRQEVVDDLELAKHGLVSVAPRMQEMALWSDGDHVQLWQDTDRTLRSIERHSHPDGAGFLKFATRLRRFGDVTRSLLLSDPCSADELKQLFIEADCADLYEEFVLLSAEALLSRYIQSDRLRGLMMFMGMVSTWGGPATPGTAYVYGYHAQGEFEGHFNRYGLPAGGMGMIAAAMQRSLVAHGGTVRLNAPVRRVLTRDGIATGVVLESGETVQAGIVVSNADPKRSLVTLVDAADLTPPVRAKAAALDQRGSMARIHLLVDQLPDYVGFTPGVRGPHHEGMIILGPTPSLYQRAEIAQAAGVFADDYVIEALIPSVTHPQLAPPGLHTLSLGVQQLPFELSQGSWDTRREEWADHVMQMYCRYAPNIAGHIRGRHTITPFDLEATYHITGGNIFHGSMVGLDHLLDHRPMTEAASYRSPIANYYLCGSGTHPGGGVTGAPGHNAAKRILADRAGLTHQRVTRERAAFAGNGPFMRTILGTAIGQRIAYRLARSRLFRSASTALSRNRR
jgi:phytoene dehydrogenase-like protein